MARKIFRDIPLEHLDSPEQLDLLTKATSPTLWLALGAGLLVAGAVAAWSVWGALPTRVSGHGILILSGGIHEVLSASSGQLEEISVKVGDTVRRGQVVARVAQPELANQILGCRGELEESARLREHLRQTAAAAEVAQADFNHKSLERKIELLEDRLYRDSRVIARESGRVIEIASEVGHIVSGGSPILSLEPLDRKLEALIYVRAVDGKRIRPGMEIDITPANVSREEYGSILGLVTYVSDYPATIQSMLRSLGQNEVLVQELTRGGAPIAVSADLLPDLVTPSGLRWTSSSGPDLPVTGGTLCSASVTVRRQQPLSLVLPFIRRTTGL